MLTGKARTYLVLSQIQDRWESFIPDQREEAERLLSKLARTLRAEATGAAPNRVPLVARISA